MLILTLQKERFGVDNVFDDGAGCQLYKEPNLGGGDVVPRDTTFIPGNAFCTDLNKIFGDWDGKSPYSPCDPRSTYFLALLEPSTSHMLGRALYIL
jgi:hypothetical protein